MDGITTNEMTVIVSGRGSGGSGINISHIQNAGGGGGGGGEDDGYGCALWARTTKNID